MDRLIIWLTGKRAGIDNASPRVDGIGEVFVRRNEVIHGPGDLALNHRRKLCAPNLEAASKIADEKIDHAASAWGVRTTSGRCSVAPGVAIRKQSVGFRASNLDAGVDGAANVDDFK